MNTAHSNTSAHAGLFIQLGLDLGDHEEPVWSLLGHLGQLVDAHFQEAPPRDVPYLRLAAGLLAHTVDDIRAGLALVRSSAETGEPLSYRRHGLVLSYMLHAIDWLNEAEEAGGIGFLEAAAQLGLTPHAVRAAVAHSLQLDTRSARADWVPVAGSARPRALLVLPPSYWLAVHTMTDLPPARRAVVQAPAVRPLVADEPQHAQQPALWGAWAKVARRGQAARRADARESRAAEAT